jgi:hypothetical protein
MNNGVELPNVPGDPASVFYALGADINKFKAMAVLGPQARLPFEPTRHEITQSIFNRMKTLGYTQIIGCGALLYNDVFPESRRHITKYCLMVVPETGALSTCAYWNCADEECEADSKAYNKALEAAYEKAGKPPPPGMLVPTQFP